MSRGCWGPSNDVGGWWWVSPLVRLLRAPHEAGAAATDAPRQTAAAGGAGGAAAPEGRGAALPVSTPVEAVGTTPSVAEHRRFAGGLLRRQGRHSVKLPDSGMEVRRAARCRRARSASGWRLVASRGNRLRAPGDTRPGQRDSLRTSARATGAASLGGLKERRSAPAKRKAASWRSGVANLERHLWLYGCQYRRGWCRPRGSRRAEGSVRQASW